MYEYRAKIIKVVDGDTVDVDIDLGFGISLNNERVRIMGIDTPESRTRDKIEKKLIQLEHALEKIAAYIYYLQNNDKEDTQVGESSDIATE